MSCPELQRYLRHVWSPGDTDDDDDDEDYE